MSSTDDNVEVKLSSLQKEIILKNLDKDGKLSCLKAFKVARLIGKKYEELSSITKSLNIRITDCELGVFGKIKFQEKNDEIYSKLLQNYIENKQIECKILWQEARNFTLKKVGSTVKNSDIEVINCQLGCFTKRKGHKR